MARNPGTDQQGRPFSQETKAKVWDKGIRIAGQDPAKVRRDACGATIAYADYGKESAQGWEIDHRKPVAKGGTDEFDNLQPMHWENNRHKSDNYPEWTCKKRA